MAVGVASPRIGAVSTTAIYMLMLVFIAKLAELHPLFGFRGLGLITVAFSLFAVFTARNKQTLREISRLSPLYKYVLVFIGMVYVSVPFSVWVTGAIDKGISYLYVVAFFFLLLVLAKGEAGLRALLGSGLVVFIVMSLTLVKNYGTGRVDVFVSSYDPNDIAYVLTSFLPLFFYSMQITRIKLVKLIGYGAILLSIVAIALTQSRGATVAFVAVLLMFLRFEKVNPRLIFAGILICIVSMFFLPETFWERMSTLVNIESDYNYTSDDGRLAIWENGISMFLHSPLTGVGVGQFSAAHFMEGHKYLTAHNALVQISAELGIVGLVCYLAMTLGPLKYLKLRNADPAMKNRPFYPLYRGLYIAFFGQFVGSLFLSVGYFHNLYYLLAIFFALNVIDRQWDQQEVVEDVIEEDEQEAPKQEEVRKRRSSYRRKGSSYTMREK